MKFEIMQTFPKKKNAPKPVGRIDPSTIERVNVELLKRNRVE